MLFGGADKLVNNNNGVTNTSFFTQSETSLLAYGNTVIASFNDSGSNAAGAGPTGGASAPGSTQWWNSDLRRNSGGTTDGGGGAGSAGFTGWSRSTDGGVTWTDGGSLPEGVGGHAGDPVLARNSATGRIYLATLGFTTSTIRIFRSDDNGVTWLPAITGTPGGSSEDKEWLTVDNNAGAGQGNVYLLSRRFGAPAGIYFYRSTNHGDTFSTGTLLWSGGQGAWVVVGPDHSIYAFSLQGNTSIQMRKSTDLGTTWSVATTIATGLGGGTNGDLALTGMRQGLGTFSSFRSNGFPQCVINPVSGHLYLVYASNPTGTDKGDIQLIMSTNSGTSWSAPTRVNDDSTLLDQWQPTIAVTPNGSHVGVFYYSRQEDASNNLFRYRGRIATVSGATLTFGASENISDVASLPEFGRDTLVNTVYMGDYDQATATNDAFHVIWADNRDNHPLAGGVPRKDPNVYYDRIPLVPAAPAVTASNFVFQNAPQRLTFTFDQNVSASLDLGDITVQKLPGGPFVNPTGLSYNAGTNTATFSFTGILPDGDYRATLLAAGITNAGGTPMAANVTHDFFFLQGDANHDRRVNLDDFNIVAANFGQSPRDFTQGDFNYNTIVNLDDFNILAAKFGTILGPSAQPGFGLGQGDSNQSTRDLIDDLLA
jgi:hypothetical protein